MYKPYDPNIIDCNPIYRFDPGSGRKKLHRGPPFKLDLRIDPVDGKLKIHARQRLKSDVHWGTRQCRAKLGCHVFENTSEDELYLIGDMYDGEHKRHSIWWNIGQAHVEGIAHVLRRKANGTKVVYLPGNHDEDIRQKTIVYRGRRQTIYVDGKPIELIPGKSYGHHNLCGKEICGIRVEESVIANIGGVNLLLIHGDKHDYEFFGKWMKPAYIIGDIFNNLLVLADIPVEWFFPKFSLSAYVKRQVKNLINGCMGVNGLIARKTDNNPHIGGEAGGHSHNAGIWFTPGGKYIVNDGSGTEHWESADVDEEGTKAVIEWRKDYFTIKDEYGYVQRYTYRELGLPAYGDKPLQEIDDIHKRHAWRIVRHAYRQWPPRSRQIYAAFMRLRNDLGLGKAFAGWTPIKNHHYRDLRDDIYASAPTISARHIVESERLAA